MTVQPFLLSQSPRFPSTGTDQDVINFAERIGGTNTFKGLPTFDPKRLVHASQSIEILKPLPLVSGPGWTIKRRLTSVRENSSCHPPCISPHDLQTDHNLLIESGVILETESLLVDPHNNPYARLFVRAHFISFHSSAFAIDVTNYPLFRFRHLVRNIQFDRKDYGKTLLPHHRFPTTTCTHPTRPRTRLCHPGPDVARAGPDIPSLRRL